MISVSINENRIEVKGHAEYAPVGSDIVCAAVSVLTLTLIQGLVNIAEIELSATQASGHVIIEWQHMNEIGKALIDTWFIGIAEIKTHYNCIEFV